MKAIVLAAIFLLGCNQRAEQEPSFILNRPALTVYTPHKKEIYSGITKEFEERTGIWVNVVNGGTNQLLERIKTEENAPICDVIFGGGVESLEAYKEYFEPYGSPELEYIQELFWSKDNSWTAFSALPIVFIYNNKLVSDKRIPDSWESLTDPYWKDKIAFASPEISGSCYTALVTMFFACREGEEWEQIEEFADNIEGRILEDSADIYKNVVKGQYFVGITLEESAWKQVNDGEDVRLLYPSDGTSVVPDGIALIKNGPNAEYARQFIDFTISRDVQEYLVSGLNRRSVRTDVGTASGLPSLEDMVQVNYDIAWAAQNKEKIVSRWKDLLREEEK